MRKWGVGVYSALHPLHGFCSKVGGGRLLGTSPFARILLQSGGWAFTRHFTLCTDFAPKWGVGVYSALHPLHGFCSKVGGGRLLGTSPFARILLQSGGWAFTRHFTLCTDFAPKWGVGVYSALHPLHGFCSKVGGGRLLGTSPFARILLQSGGWAFTRHFTLCTDFAPKWGVGVYNVMGLYSVLYGSSILMMQSCANHVQQIERLLHAACRVPRGTKGQFS